MATEHTIRATTCPGVSLRPCEDGDMEFLYGVYAGTRDWEMALLADWSEADKEQFLRWQFKAQHQHYQQHYPNAAYEVIVKDGADIGRLYVARLRNELRVMDIALLPGYRHQGIGSALMHELMDEAGRARKFVSLHVEEYNPAKRLYERMGFAVVGDVSCYKLMHWIPPGVTPVYGDDVAAIRAQNQVKTAS